MKRPFILLVIISGLCVWLAATTQIPTPATGNQEDTTLIDDAEALRLDSLRVADSIATAQARRLADIASESYKELKFIQYDGVTEAQLYPHVISVHQNVLQAIDAEKLGNDDRQRLKSYLLDLDPLLMQGAIFYSAQHDQKPMNTFAKACVDTRMRPDMKGMPFGRSGDALYPHMVYCAASSTYNSGDFAHAIDYFEEYLSTPAQENRAQIALFLGQACINAGCPERSIPLLVEAANAFPTDYNLLMITLQNCLDAGETEQMTPLMERALLMKPNDEQLLNVQAALYENQGNYSGALDLYGRLYEMHPESLAVNQHLALCYYNLGVEYYNKAMTEENEKTAKRNIRQSNAYLASAAQKLGAVVDNEPTNTKYLRALAMTYGCLGEGVKLAELNKRLVALGMRPVNAAGMPETVAFDDKASTAGKNQTVPPYQDYARSYVEKSLAEWTTRREFEKKEDFEKRVSKNNVYAEYERLCKKAEEAYLRKYAKYLKISDLTLEPYDIDNESYRIKTGYGPIVVKVPLKGKEAETFKAQWNTVQMRNPKFYIEGNRPAIASVDLTVPGGKTYSYNAANAATYAYTPVKIDVNSFIEAGEAERDSYTASNNQRGGSETVIRAKSDVDENIPITTRQAKKTVALIWANENYKNVTPVVSALNDGETFAQYCRNTLGIPDSQVILLKDVTYAEMLGSITKLEQVVGTLGEGVDVIFYYAGHGIPDEATKDAFLLPVDGDGVMTIVTYPLKKLYSDLAAMRSENTMVFLDACFSGATRDGGMFAETRGVALKPRVAEPEGSMFVLSAASDQETALPYREKNHGMFTYFLLKRLQETKGNVTLRDLADYVTNNVKKQSLTVNRKIQTPSVRVSGRMTDEWNSKKMRP